MTHTPTDLLHALRTARAAGADAQAPALDEHGLRALDGDRNNDVFARTAPSTPICIKLHKKSDRQRVKHEWRGPPTQPAWAARRHSHGSTRTTISRHWA